MKTYLVKYENEWILGWFEKQWYGWNFDWYVSGMCGLQLDDLDEVYEVKLRALEQFTSDL